MDASDLPTRMPDYFPPAVGRYEIKPGLVQFGRPLGGGQADGHVFQLDATFSHYRRTKLVARGERLGKYFQTRELTPAVERAVAGFMIDRLTREHFEHFSFADGVLSSSLTGERLHFDVDLHLRRIEGPACVAPPYTSTLDALASQVQEDLAVVSTSDGRHWLSAVHLSFPNHWAAEDKIGRTFPLIHAPVAGMDQMNRQADQLVRLMVEATAGLVRFAWGVTWDDALNHHPEPPPGAVRGEAFDALRPVAFLRVERQTVWGFPEVGAALFTIRTYLIDVATIRQDPCRRGQLVAALTSMSDASVAYKGLAGSRESLVQWVAMDETT